LAIDSQVGGDGKAKENQLSLAFQSVRATEHTCPGKASEGQTEGLGAKSLAPLSFVSVRELAIDERLWVSNALRNVSACMQKPPWGRPECKKRPMKAVGSEKPALTWRIA